MVNTIQMTQTGYDELAKELEELKTTKRSEIAEKIKIARGYGDLSENSEYDAAKNEQAEIEARIAVLEEQLKACDHRGYRQPFAGCGGGWLQGEGAG